MSTTSTPEKVLRTPVEELREEVLDSDPQRAASLLADRPAETAAQVLALTPPGFTLDVLWAMEDEERSRVLAATPPDLREQWIRNREWPEDSVGRLLEPPRAVFRPSATVAETVAKLRDLVRSALISYGWVTDDDGRLVGLLIFREMLFADPAARLSDIMLKEPFTLRADTTVADAMREVVVRHYPAYPVVDAGGRLVGVLRGQTLFEAQAFEISAQPGKMVGVETEERLSTPWWRSLKSRHPWLQLNLVTAFAAAAVVGMFEGTVERIVLLAAFLPVLAGQSGNTGCQALAVCLRAMTVGDLEEGGKRRVVLKEAALGLCNGALVGLTAGAGMWIYASSQDSPHALGLAVIVLVAMILSCVVSGLSGAVIPLALKRLGADPATASSIFLTTATDVVSMGVFLGLATAFLT